jgi:hypothetical protein
MLLPRQPIDRETRARSSCSLKTYPTQQFEYFIFQYLSDATLTAKMQRQNLTGVCEQGRGSSDDARSRNLT